VIKLTAMDDLSFVESRNLVHVEHVFGGRASRRHKGVLVWFYVVISIHV
jgi:hypothetical protein